jgi:hypothetical protein
MVIWIVLCAVPRVLNESLCPFFVVALSYYLLSSALVARRDIVSRHSR